MINLGLFMTKGVGIKTWLRDGIFSREIRLYEELLKRNVQTTIFSYDNYLFNSKKVLEKGLKQKRISERLFERNMLINFFDKAYLSSAIKKIDIIRTNQFLGAREALSAARKFNKPLIVRGGYVASRFASWQGKSMDVIREIEEEERDAFNYASAIIVTTESMKEYIKENYAVSEGKINVIGNCIPEVFFKAAEIKNYDNNTNTVLAVGRHHPQKDYSLLFDAIKDVDYIKLKIIGGGSDYDKNSEIAKGKDLNFEFIRSLPNNKIPEELSASSIYVMTSKYEGHPKALLEAMAAGCACVVTKGPGVDSEIQHNVNGVVVPRESGALRDVIIDLLKNTDLRKKLGKTASEYIRKKYSVESSVNAEESLYKRILGING